MRYPASWLQGASLGESISSELRLQIILGTIKPGTVLTENRIAGDFGTSRSPVRESLRTLAAEGLIRLERMGAIVLGLNMRDVVELYDVRYLIESFAQQRLAVSCTEEFLHRLRQIVDRMELAAKHHDPVEFSFQDLTFHETMIQEADHSRILHLWNSIRQIVMTLQLVTTEAVFSLGDSNIERVIGKHRRLIDSLESRDIDRIHKEVENYFSDSRSTLERSLPKR